VYIHTVLPSETISMPIMPVLSMRNLPDLSTTMAMDISILFWRLAPFISMT
jgi:hypothetical protein